MLWDDKVGVGYIPISLSLLKELRVWSEPVSVKFDGETLTFKKLGQPVKGVYIVDEQDQVDALLHGGKEVAA
jgi:hypothetical protein